MSTAIALVYPFGRLRRPSVPEAGARAVPLLGSRNGEARALDLLGQVHLRLGQHEQARDHHQRALDAYRDAGVSGRVVRPFTPAR
ncbi:tetratricopeptide repeat protein [Actinomadura sp. SCN-SB]|uniref:tetratricopeptide repeat protein n=1 Tax=Actinomadura sp. SCN-SB TaxID=3373092 RepID=UPI0037503C0A